MAISKTALQAAVLYPVTYGFLLIVMFAVAYRSMGLEKNFVITDEMKAKPWFASFYISLMAQTNAMGDATPKTIPARVVFGLQTMMGWLWVVTFAALVAAFFAN